MDDVVTPTELAYHEAGHAVVNRHLGIPVLPGLIVLALVRSLAELSSGVGEA